MSKILKEFYNGNIVPSNQSGDNSQYNQDILHLIENNRKKLCQGLSEEQKEILDKYDSHVADMNELLCEDSFVSGYRLGTRMTAEAFTKE